MRDRSLDPRESVASGHLLAAVLVIVSFGLSLTGGAASLVYYGFPVASALITIELLRRHYWYSYLSFTAWMWFLSPFLRRVVDWKIGYHQSSLILLAPAVAGLLAIPVALRYRRHVDRTIGRLFAFAALTFVYAALTGLLRNGVTAVGVDVLAIIGPFGAGLFAMTVPSDPAKLRKAIVSIAVWGTIVMGAYGVVQFFVVPAWDAAWIADTGITTAGQAKPGAIRVFSTLNTSNPFGEVIAGTLLISLAERRIVLRSFAVVFGFLALGLSLVRAAWIAIAVGFAGLVNNNRLKVTTVAIVAGAGLIALLAFGGSITNSLSDRVNNSVTAGSSDQSLNSRLDFQRQIAGPTLADPIGQGMGATGAALRTSGSALVGGTDKRLANFDSGVFENATTYGSVLGIILFFWLIFGNIAAWRRSRGGAPELAFFSAAITMLMVSMFFANTTKDAPGFLLWVLLAVVARAVGNRTAAESADAESSAAPDTAEPDTAKAAVETMPLERSSAPVALGAGAVASALEGAPGVATLDRRVTVAPLGTAGSGGSGRRALPKPLPPRAPLRLRPPE